MTASEVKRQLTMLPSEIALVSKEILDIINEKTAIQRKIDALEVSIRSQVGKNKDIKNDTDRKAEVQLLLIQNEEYNQFQTTLSVTTEKLELSKIEHQFKRDQFNATIAIAGIQ
jgi:hypothetical protein